MSYSILIERQAQKALKKIPSPLKLHVAGAIRELAELPRPHGSKKLTGRDAWRIRIGDFRVIYEIDDDKKSILVVVVGDRKKVYRQR